MSRSLYEITEDFTELETKLDALDDNDIESTSELLQWMNDLSSERAAKIDAYCWVIRKLQAEADTAKQIAAEFREKQQSREGRVDMLKSLIYQHMKSLNHPKLFGKQFTVSIQKNGGNIPVDIIDEEALPDSLCRIQRIPIKDEIRKELEHGKDIPGARLGVRGESIRIK